MTHVNTKIRNDDFINIIDYFLFTVHIIKLISFLKLLTVKYEEDYQIGTYVSNSQMNRDDLLGRGGGIGGGVPPWKIGGRSSPWKTGVMSPLLVKLRAQKERPSTF